MAKQKTAHEKIKRFLEGGGVITGYIAWTKFSCYRLSSVIHRLRTNEHMHIKMEMVFKGKDYAYATYKLVKE